MDEYIAWFERYVATFMTGDEQHRQVIEMKRMHSRCVLQEAETLCAREHIPGHTRALILIAALLHDVGRFGQFARHRTLVDQDSEDHGTSGVHVLEAHNVLASCEASERAIILKAVEGHNKVAIPAHETAECHTVMALVRDADKLDILRVVCDHYERRAHEDDGTVSWDMPDLPLISEAVCDDLRARRVVAFAHLASLNDLKLLNMSWVFDCNFTSTLAMIKERGYLERLRRTVLPDPRLAAIDRTIADYMHTRLHQA